MYVFSNLNGQSLYIHIFVGSLVGRWQIEKSHTLCSKIRWQTIQTLRIYIQRSFTYILYRFGCGPYKINFGRVSCSDPAKRFIIIKKHHPIRLRVHAPPLSYATCQYPHPPLRFDCQSSYTFSITSFFGWVSFSVMSLWVLTGYSYIDISHLVTIRIIWKCLTRFCRRRCVAFLRITLAFMTNQACEMRL